jgi:hypothetical protein
MSEVWPAGELPRPAADPALVRYAATTESVRHRFAEHPFRHYSFGVWRDGDRVRGLIVFRRGRLRGIPGVALLAAYGDDLPQLLLRWAAAVRRRRVPIVHVLTSPASPMRDLVRVIGTRVTVPFSREPYHLIARALRDDTPRVLFDLDRWDCIGGDIL